MSNAKNRRQPELSHSSFLPHLSMEPRVHESVFVAPGAFIIGDVEIGEDSSIWYQTVLRGDVHQIRIGRRTNIQDACVGHVTNGTHPLIIGNEVTVGHRAVLHGCTIHDRCLIGIGAIVLDGATVESGSMVAAGALIPPGMRVESGTLVGGVPARVMRSLRDHEHDELSASAERYVGYARDSRSSISI